MFGLFLSGGISAQQAAPDEPRFRVDVRAALYEVRVRNAAGNVMRGLQQREFRVFEDGKPRPLTHFEESPSEKISLAILLDIGATMSSQKILLGRRVMQQLVHLLDPLDEVLLGVYHRDVDFVCELTTDRYRMMDGIQNIGSGARPGKWGGLANLFMSSSLTGYAVDESLLKLKKARNPVKAVLAVSAGFGGIGEATLDHLRLAGSRFFAVSLGNRAGDIFSLGGDQAARKRIVRDTGGIAYSGKEVLERLEQLRDSLKHFYLLAYSPAPGGGNWLDRKIEVRLPGHPKAQISFVRRTRSGSSFY
ncbi:MAG: hypothetical protein V3T83_06285 [Acidobacteriota bacterium]